VSDGDEKRREQKLIIGLFVALVAASAVVAPMMLSGGDQRQVDPREGSVTTPQPTATPDQQPSLDRERPDLEQTRLSSIPESHATATASDGPPVPDSVSASAGAQTMRVETTMIDGEPALQLRDDSRHDGRWVSIETAWLESNLGEVPDTVTVAHETNGTYVSELQVRGESAAFYVEGFSTNTVTFGGEIAASGRYQDGSGFAYNISDLDAAGQFEIDATGVLGSEWDNETASGLASGATLATQIAGSGPPLDQSATLIGEATTSAGSASATDVTDGTSTQTGISTAAEGIEGASVTFSGQETTAPSSASFVSSNKVVDDTFTVDGSQPPTDATLTITNTGAKSTRLAPNINGENAPYAFVDPGQSKTYTVTSLLTTGSNTIQYSTSLTGDVSWTYELSWTEQTATDSPGLDLDGDGTTDVSHSGILLQDETATVSIPDSAIGPSTSSVTTTLAGGSVDWTLDYQRVDHTEDPALVAPNGTTILSHNGLLAPGETVTGGLGSTLTTSTTGLDVTTTSGTVGATASFQEIAATEGLTVSVNGNKVSHTGTIADGETVSLNADTAWLQPGVNRVDVSLAAPASADAPAPEVALDYSHTLSDRVTVSYQSEAFSERYNVSRSYASDRSSATLTIPHAGNVLSLRNLDYQVDGGGWQSIPEGAATLDTTTLSVDMSALAGDPIPESTTVDVRSTASKVQVDGGEISVLQPTAVGFDLASKIRLESWSDGASIALGGTPQGSLVHYATEESYSAEDDYVSIASDGSQRLYLPAASDGSELTIKTLPVDATPETNDMEIRVPDAANASNIEMVVSGGPVVGDSWTATYVGATEGAWYGLVGENGDRLARAQAPDVLTIDRDDLGLVMIEGVQPPSEDKPAGAGAAIFSTLGGPTFLPLIVIFGGVGAIGLAGRRPEESRESIRGLADGLGNAIAIVPVIGEPVSGPVEGLITSLGDAAVSLGESELAVGGIAVIAAVAAEQANLYSVGPQVAAIGAIGTVAVGSLIALRRTDSFSIQIWGGIVGATTLIALQTLGQTDIIAAVTESDAFLFVIIGGLYLAYRALNAWQSAEEAENAPPEITIDASSLNDDGES